MNGSRSVTTTTYTRNVCNKPGSSVDCFITNIIAQTERLVDMTRVTCADDARHIGRGTLSYSFMSAVTPGFEGNSLRLEIERLTSH